MLMNKPTLKTLHIQIQILRRHLTATGMRFYDIMVQENEYQHSESWENIYQALWLYYDVPKSYDDTMATIS